MAFKTLIVSLRGLGKTTLVRAFIQHLNAVKPQIIIDWFNAYSIREQLDDWDFSGEGRLHQRERMAKLANILKKDLVICDVVAPIKTRRDTFSANCTICLNNITVSRYGDTSLLFRSPKSFALRVTKRNPEAWVEPISKYLIDAI